MNMDYVDTHFHVWALEKFKYPWPTPDIKLYRNYYPSDLESSIEGTPVKHAIFVQCLNGSKEEAEWVMDMATRHPVIAGVVAGLDLISPNLEETIDSLKPKGLLKGVRHLIDMEDDDWITRDDVSKGFDTLAKHNLVYDLQADPCHLKYIPKVASRHPKLRFIIDHLANPIYSEKKMEGWRDEMTEIAKCSNVYCKISGIISGQKPDNWKSLDYQPFIDHVFSVFGVDRCMFGSDWPLCELVDATYKDNLAFIQKLVSKLDVADQKKIFRENAIKFYNLSLGN